jgi:hypothetical protein
MLNLELAQPKHLISLSTSAHLVHVQVKTWTATSQNKAISQEVTAAKNASSDAGRFTQNLLNNAPQHRALMNHRQTVNNWLQRITYDWAGDWRILPAYRIEEFARGYTKMEQEYDMLKNEFFNVYPSLISDAAFKQGDMFDRTLYPEIEELMHRFTMKKFITEVPQSDFRASISSVIAEDLKNHYESQVNSVVQQMMDDMKGQLVSHAMRLRNSCEEAHSDEGKKVKRKRIYESTFDNVRSMVSLLDKFNITQDPELEDARRKLEATLQDMSLDDLRESAAARAEVRDGLGDILEMFGALGAATDDEEE